MSFRTPFLLSVATMLLLGVSQSWLAGSVAQHTSGASLAAATGDKGHAAPSLVGSLFEDPSAPAVMAALDHDDIPDAYQALWNEALQSLPAECRSALQDVYVQFNRPHQRGLASDRSIILYAGFDLNDPQQRDEARALFIHEFGHITDLGCLIGRSLEPSGFMDGSKVIPSDDPSLAFYVLSWTDDRTRRADSRPEDFVTGYAAHDPFEDFSETYAYFALQEPAFAARAANNAVLAKKYDFMKTVVFASGAPNALGLSVADGTVPWDATLLPYAWTGGLVASY